MGTWSTGLYGDDEAQDARDAYREILSLGIDGTKATDRFLKEWKGALKDSDDGPVIWLALADTQWSLGRLEDRVRDQAIRIIDEGSSLDRWREASPKLLAKREQVLRELKEKLLKPQPPVKKIRVQEKAPQPVANKLLKPGDLRKLLKSLYWSLEPSRGNALTSVSCPRGMTNLLLENLECVADSLERLHITQSEEVTDEGMASVGRLTRVKHLGLERLKITDRGLAHLDGLSQLVYVNISGSPRVTDAGVARFAKCKNLEWVDFGGTAITDETLTWISQLKNLKQLWLRSTAVTDAGVERLKDLRRLEMLFLGGARVTDRGMAVLARLPQLTWLDIARTAVTDKGISCLAESRSLKSLDLEGTAVTDACVPALQKLAPLKYLEVSRTGISAKARALLQ